MKSMLLISDRTDFQRRIAQAMAADEWAVTVVDQLRSALVTIAERKPDIVLIDRLATAFDGFDVLLELKTRFPYLPILVYLLKSTDTGETHRQRIRGLLGGKRRHDARIREPA